MSTVLGAATVLHQKILGCLLGGLIGDAIGTPSEGKEYPEIERAFGWIEDFDADGTDDTIMKTLLCRALSRTGGYAMLDDWAAEWLADWDAMFGDKRSKFFISVHHTARKIHDHTIPRMAALGNMPSSSSAMAISPVGIVNACNPRQAALQAYNIASLIHVHDVGYCQDGAAAIAAAVAQAFTPGATVESIIAAATAYIAQASGKEMLAAIAAMLSVAREQPTFKGFRNAIYDHRDEFFKTITCDSRETVPLALALFVVAGGDFEKTVQYGANFGRDADTIATMSGAISGALHGVDGIRRDWVEKAQRLSSINQQELAGQLATAAMKKAEAESAAIARFRQIAEGR